MHVKQRWHPTVDGTNLAPPGGHAPRTPCCRWAAPGTGAPPRSPHLQCWWPLHWRCSSGARLFPLVWGSCYSTVWTSNIKIGGAARGVVYTAANVPACQVVQDSFHQLYAHRAFWVCLRGCATTRPQPSRSPHPKLSLSPLGRFSPRDCIFWICLSERPHDQTVSRSPRYRHAQLYGRTARRCGKTQELKHLSRLFSPTGSDAYNSCVAPGRRRAPRSHAIPAPHAPWDPRP